MMRPLDCMMFTMSLPCLIQHVRTRKGGHAYTVPTTVIYGGSEEVLWHAQSAGISSLVSSSCSMWIALPNASAGFLLYATIRWWAGPFLIDRHKTLCGEARMIPSACMIDAVVRRAHPTVSSHFAVCRPESSTRSGVMISSANLVLFTNEQSRQV